MGGLLKQAAPLAVLALVTCGCDDSNVSAPTKQTLTYSSTTVSSNTTFVSNAGLSMTCSVENPAMPSQGSYPIPPLGNPVPPMGNSIPITMNSSQSVAAVAIFAPRSIGLNVAFLNPLVLPVQGFVFFRECGRFNVSDHDGPGHIDGANCWSIRRLRQMNLFGPSDQSAIQRFLEQKYPTATSSMPSGADQWRALGSCSGRG